MSKTTPEEVEAREHELTRRLSHEEFESRGQARSRYHTRLFEQGRPRPTNEEFDEGFDAGVQFVRGRWTPIEEAEVSKSLQWLFIRNSNGEEGVRIGLREDTGWTIVNEFGQSQWVPGTLGVVAVMALNVPKDGQFNLLPAEEKTIDD